ncbi:MAG: redoxin domain-containing protein [Phycisphaerales bacterium]
MSLNRSLVLGLVAGLIVPVAAFAQEAQPTAEAPAPVAEAGPTLKVGDAAPAIKVAKWFKGNEVKSFEEGKVYVVEFWATWCGPCKRTIPHLTKLAAEMKDKVTVVGVSVWEKRPEEPGTEYLTKVEKFVTKMGPKMEYVIAADTGEGDMAKTWVEAAKSPGIPAAFVVGKTGKIEWTGHPMEGLDEVVAEVAAGTYTAEKAEAIKAAAAKKMEAEEEKGRAQQTAMQEIMSLSEQGKSAEALAALDKLSAGITDEDMLAELSMQRYVLLSKSDEPAAIALAKQLGAGAAKENPRMLYELANPMIEGTDFKNPDYALAVDLVSQAMKVHREENDNKDHPALVSLLAKAQFKKGDIDAAIATQEGAMKLLADFGPSVPAEVTAQYQTALDEYKAAKK